MDQPARAGYGEQAAGWVIAITAWPACRPFAAGTIALPPGSFPVHVSPALVLVLPPRWLTV